MTDRPPTVASLKRECHALIESIARHPYRIKLLIGARRMLMMFAQDKRDRQVRERSSEGLR